MAALRLPFLLAALAAPASAYTPHGQACQDPATQGFPFCDPALPVATRAADFISRLTVAEKIGLSGTFVGDICAGVDGGVPRLSVPPLSCLIECTGAVSSGCYVDENGINYCPTVFPAPLSVAASFNRTLMYVRGLVTGSEARAFNNLHVNRVYGNPVDLLAFGPDLNLIVDPRNGRNGENPSEDGYLSGEYAIQYVHGAQENADDPSHIMLSMALKHFAGYQSETNRFDSDFAFSAFDLLDTFLVPYESGFMRGGAVGSMCSYNSLNNISACADRWLLTSMVREYWQRPDAYVMSDCGAVEDQFEDKKTALSYADAAAQSLSAGTDWCMGTDFVMKNGLSDALSQGLANVSQIDAALMRTMSVRVRLGLFDPPGVLSAFTTYGKEKINSAANRQEAEVAAAQGSVLLRNQKSLLPIDLANSPALKSIAVVGPHAVTQRDLLGDFYADAFCPGVNNQSVRQQGCVPTIASSIMNVVATARPDVAVSVARGVQVSGGDLSGVPAAVAAVNAADVVFLCVGYNNADVEREGADHDYTTLPPLQEQLADDVISAASARGVPVVMILVNAGQIAFDTLKAQPDVTIEAFYPSFGAPAIARQIFGLSNRWGRLPYTLYPASFASAIALSDMNVSGAVGRTWRYYSGTPIYAFGDGLSYSTFSLACAGGPSSVDASSSFAIAVNCSSALAAGFPEGDEILHVVHRAGADVVAAVGGRFPVPRGTLRDFSRSSLALGGAPAAAAFSLAPRDLALTDAGGNSVVFPGTHYIDVSPRAPGAKWTMTVTVTGAAPVVIASPPPLPR
jgi:beta-glucosidase-like glycosyl hydrolase